MLARAFRSLKTTPKDETDPLQPRRMANTEKFAGGRGSTAGVLRGEKRSAGRVRTAKVRCNLGEVQDLSATGCRVSTSKKPTLAVGASVRLEMNAEDVAFTIPATVMWVRVMKDCTFHLGLQFTQTDAARRKQLLDLVRTGVANDGLTRGWSPMA